MTKKSTNQLDIRSIGSPDIEVLSWTPRTPAEVFFLVEMEIGEVGAIGADLFQIVIATPEALRARSKTGMHTISERSTLVIAHFDWKETLKSLEAIVRKCEANNWVDSTLKLQRYFQWEYEDYKMEGEI